MSDATSGAGSVVSTATNGAASVATNNPNAAASNVDILAGGRTFVAFVGAAVAGGIMVAM